MPTDIRTKAIVLRRTNYGESDRILNLLTENGIISVLARGVRKEKSKMAGGVEMFCVSDIVYHEGKNNSLGVLTSAKMLEAYQKIVTDLTKLEVGSNILKAVYRSGESAAGSDFFKVTKQAISALNTNLDINMIEAWFWLNFAKISGEEVNLFRDTSGEKLSPAQTYVWDSVENALRPQIGGNIGPSEIKLMRLMVSSDLETIARVKDVAKKWPSILYLAKSANKL